MMPKDLSDPRAYFVGVDFTVEVRATGVFDHAQLESTVDGLIFDFFQQRHIVARPCHIGGLGSATGGQLVELINWVKDNWEILSGVVAALAASYYKGKQLLSRIRRHLIDRVIDPYRADIIVTVSPRTGSLGTEVGDEDRAVFPTILLMFPELHVALVKEVPTHNFSLRAIRRGQSSAPNAFFKLKTTTRHDVAMMLRKIKKLEASSASAPTILMYRRFGVLRSFDVSRDPAAFYRLWRR